MVEQSSPGNRDGMKGDAWRVAEAKSCQHQNIPGNLPLQVAQFDPASFVHGIIAPT